MKTLVMATLVLFAGAGGSWAQATNDSCGDVISNPNASCPSVMDPSAGGSVNSQAAPGSSNGLIDNQTTGSIQNPPIDTGFGITSPNTMPPVPVQNDPLGQNIGQNPFGGGNQIGIPRPRSLGTNGVSVPSIR
ncbi:hypothetical protein [Mesorhizobium sp. CN2-181]|uniref:hypothetical protein n=1 Tax=Mesorhizobium yinganensis TaxID=3157707 RepID=UPI0032B77B09